MVPELRPPHPPHCRGSTTIFWPVPNIDSAPVCLSSLVRENLFGTSDALASAIGSHYLYAVLRQVPTSASSISYHSIISSHDSITFTHRKSSALTTPLPHHHPNPQASAINHPHTITS